MSDCTNCEYFKTIKESSIIPLNCRECVWQGNGKEDNYKALSVVNVEYDMFYCNSCGQEIKQINGKIRKIKFRGYSFNGVVCNSCIDNKERCYKEMMLNIHELH